MSERYVRPAPGQRFDLLDGARGVAALAITVDHFTLQNGLHWFAGAWVAVDFFFILSGFVITQAYAGRVNQGLGLAAFMSARVRRLWPLYALGLVLGLAAALVMLWQGRAPLIVPGDIAKALGLGLVFLPYLNELPWPTPGGVPFVGAAFPMNVSTWTLFFELLVNLLFYWRLRLLRAAAGAGRAEPARGALLGLVLAALLLYVLGGQLWGYYNPGWASSSFFWCLPRVVAEFFIGALIFERGLFRMQPRPVLAALLAVAWVALMWTGRGKLQWLNMLVVVPALVLTLSSLKVGAAGKRVCQGLGGLSFPLFIVHYPLHQLLAWSTPLMSWPPLVQLALFLPTAVALALALGRLDRWLRSGPRAQGHSGLGARAAPQAAPE